MSLPLVLIMGQMNPNHTLPSYFLNIYSNIAFPSIPMSSDWYIKGVMEVKRA
jgi:hypothetical protein